MRLFTTVGTSAAVAVLFMGTLVVGCRGGRQAPSGEKADLAPAAGQPPVVGHRAAPSPQPEIEPVPAGPTAGSTATALTTEPVVISWDNVPATQPVRTERTLQTIGGTVHSWRAYYYENANGTEMVAIELLAPEQKRLSAGEAERLLMASEREDEPLPGMGGGEVVSPSDIREIRAEEPQYGDLPPGQPPADPDKPDRPAPGKRLAP